MLHLQCGCIGRAGKEVLVLTQVSQAPLLGPKARSQAGSRDWKNSSGWKKVVTQKALMRRMMMMLRRKARLFCDEGCDMAV